ncbi:unnamed protein product [Brugia pahangi]|uniref:DUF4058 family protein n=1 Tax=Brugia pahangi TaxID=6280 RepID=A0A0N4TER8_BRUPA|nr:unnamed protein product [Brugia pahangi]
MNDQTENETIRMRQIASLKQLLNLNQPLPVSMAVEPVWKILILDRYGQDIISPLLTIKQLRDMGITLHLYLLIVFSINYSRYCLFGIKPVILFFSPRISELRANDLIFDC